VPRGRSTGSTPAASRPLIDRELTVAELLTTRQAAERLGVTVRQLRRLRRRHPLAEYRLGGEAAHPRFLVTDLDDWRDRHFRREPQRPPVASASSRRRPSGRRDWAAVVAGEA